ncbi:MAG: class I SAM-dependent methyltransferase [Anaerolineae bacterium]|nr:class I SAM-dependent methyltransferase [Anaerolineae bacterium]
MNPWVIRGVIAVVILFLLDREIYLYEGVHLGPRVQGWLYDRWAAKYDSDKRASQAHDAVRLAQPLVKALHEAQVAEPFMLDVATGTGRLPLVLMQDPAFKGYIIGLDLSHDMLASAAQKLNAYRDRVTFIRHTAFELPFPDDSFDVVSCMEALEIMPNMEQPLAEFARVLRPGGIFVTTHGTKDLGLWRKVVDADTFRGLLHAVQFEQIEIEPWWEKFNLVWARKAGTSVPVAHHTITDVLRCPACGAVAYAFTSDAAPTTLVCGNCQAEKLISEEAIILF